MTSRRDRFAIHLCRPRAQVARLQDVGLAPFGLRSEEKDEHDDQDPEEDVDQETLGLFPQVGEH